MSIQVASFLVPKNGNTWPVLEDVFIKGGFRAVADQTARNTIDAAGMKAGMLVSVLADNKIYQLGSDLATWSEVSLQGPQGIQGIQGPAGNDGAPGAAGPTGPQGLKGDTGATGAKGDTGLTGPTGSQGPQGIQGPAGTNGTSGASATVGVGSVSTGAAGTSATVTNAGTPSAAIFNFTIPRGADGAVGPAGSNGVSVTSASVNGSNHLILTMSDSSQIDAGALPSGGSSSTLGQVRASRYQINNVAGREAFVDASAPVKALGTVTSGSVGSASMVATITGGSVAVNDYVVCYQAGKVAGFGYVNTLTGGSASITGWYMLSVTIGQPVEFCDAVGIQYVQADDVTVATTIADIYGARLILNPSGQCTVTALRIRLGANTRPNAISYFNTILNVTNADLNNGVGLAANASNWIYPQFSVRQDVDALTVVSATVARNVGSNFGKLQFAGLPTVNTTPLLISYNW